MGWKLGQKLDPQTWAKVNVDSDQNVMDRWMAEGTQTPRWQRAKMCVLLRQAVHPDDFKAFLKEAHEWNKQVKEVLPVDETPVILKT